jgi:hypothetical protein
MLDQFNNLPERWIIIIQPWDDPAMQIAHIIAMEMNFEPIMIIGHDRTRDLTHILAIHHNSHHHPILHIWSWKEISDQEVWLSDVLHKLGDLNIKNIQDLILTLQAEQEDISPLQDSIREDQRKYFWIDRKNYKKNQNNTLPKQSYRSHTQKKR